jgi:1,4-alpha-glucan branching enzyme
MEMLGTYKGAEHFISQFIGGGYRMSLRKQYLKSKPVCKVTFNLSKEESNSAETASLVGDFNEWDTSATPMRRFKNGNFTVTLDLEPKKEYQYRYLLNGQDWVNDPMADKYVSVPDLNAENSVVAL